MKENNNAYGTKDSQQNYQEYLRQSAQTALGTQGHTQGGSMNSTATGNIVGLRNQNTNDAGINVNQQMNTRSSSVARLHQNNGKNGSAQGVTNNQYSVGLGSTQPR